MSVNSVDGSMGGGIAPQVEAPRPPPPPPPPPAPPAEAAPAPAAKDDYVPAQKKPDPVTLGGGGQGDTKVYADVPTFKPNQLHTFSGKGVKADSAAPAAGVKPIAMGERTHEQVDGYLLGKDGFYDPKDPNLKVSNIEGVKPDSTGKPPTGRKVFHVNGIDTTQEQFQEELKVLANGTGDEVIGIYNATSGKVDPNTPIIGGFLGGVALGDIVQTAGDKLGGISGNKATETLTNLVHASVSKGQKINISGYSQGAAVVSRSLDNVKNKLVDDTGGFFFNIGNDKKKELSLVNVETYGGAADNFIDGPNYTHYVNKADTVPTALGLYDNGNPFNLRLNKPNPGRDAEGRPATVKYFEDHGAPEGQQSLVSPHLLSVYMNHRPYQGPATAK